MSLRKIFLSYLLRTPAIIWDRLPDSLTNAIVDLYMDEIARENRPKRLPGVGGTILHFRNGGR
jgi:hypothetical protein